LGMSNIECSPQSVYLIETIARHLTQIFKRIERRIRPIRSDYHPSVSPINLN
jgi:hypothetical protein